MGDERVPEKDNGGRVRNGNRGAKKTYATNMWWRKKWRKWLVEIQVECWGCTVLMNACAL